MFAISVDMLPLILNLKEIWIIHYLSEYRTVYSINMLIVSKNL